MGLETEFGILGDAPGLNPMLLSAQIVTAYATFGLPSGVGPRWDYSDEDPLNDARGWRLERKRADPSQLTDRPPQVQSPIHDVDHKPSAGHEPSQGRTESSVGDVGTSWVRDVGSSGLGADPDSGAAPPAQAGAAPPPQHRRDVHSPLEASDWPRVSERRRPAPEAEPPTVANVVLPNGARFYVDHAHPEHSGPETTNPRQAVIWDRAGDQIALRASRLLAQRPGMPSIALYKNNTDGKGASYGTHENYLVDRQVPFGDLITYLTPFLVTRPVFCGAGRVGLGQRGERPGFQISQRADFIEAEVGLETTLRRPIINTRDEPHADAERFRRLHLIVGDANLLEVSAFLKLGTTSMLLWLIEQDAVPLELSALRLADPVGAAQQVSYDTRLSTELDLADGRRMTAVQIQQVYAEVIANAVREHAEGTGTDVDEQTTEVLHRWRDVLDRLSTDPATCAREVEWLAKLRVLEAMRRRSGSDWDDPRLAALDLQWSDLRPEKGIYARLVNAGAVDQLVTDAEVEAAIQYAPTDTRAYFRGEAIRRHREYVSAASWDAVVFDVPGQDTLKRVPTPDPYRGTAEHLGEVLATYDDVHDLISALTRGE